MTDFDYNNNSIVGYVDFILGSTNAKIEVVGYVDLRNKFTKLKENEIKTLFPPQGKVFAHNLSERHNDTKGTLVRIDVIPNEKIGERLDAFVWKKSGGVQEFGTKVRKLKGTFSTNGQYNYSLLKENNLLNLEDNTYISSNGTIYLIKADSQERLVPYWKEGSLNTITVNGKLFVIETIKNIEDGKIDITTDEQLIEWYMKNILKKNWSQIFEEKSFRNVEPLLRDAFAVSKGLDGLVVSSRIKRLTHITRALTLSFEEINSLKTLPWLKESIEQSISVHKDSYLEEVEREKAKELQEIREQYDMEILVEKEKAENEKQKLSKDFENSSKMFQTKLAEYETLLQEKQIETDIIDETIQKKRTCITSLEESINRLEKRKDDIVNDFSIVKEVLGANNCTKRASMPASYSMEELNLADTPIPIYQAFIKSIENTLKANNIPHDNSSTIGQQLIAFKILLVPDASIAKAIIVASKKCRYFVEYVSATWKSFGDLWENGLGAIIEECSKNEGLMHFLILQNINLTYVPNFMMPLIDIQKGITSKIPCIGKPFPDNLRILCTITKDEVMPLSEDYLQYIGCIDKNISKEHYGNIVVPDDSNIGFLTPKVLNESNEYAKDIPNFHKCYIENE